MHGAIPSFPRRLARNRRSVGAAITAQRTRAQQGGESDQRGKKKRQRAVGSGGGGDRSSKGARPAGVHAFSSASTVRAGRDARIAVETAKRRAKGYHDAWLRRSSPRDGRQRPGPGARSGWPATSHRTYVVDGGVAAEGQAARRKRGARGPLVRPSPSLIPRQAPGRPEPISPSFVVRWPLHFVVRRLLSVVINLPQGTAHNHEREPQD
jgi:hypothetical protein